MIREMIPMVVTGQDLDWLVVSRFTTFLDKQSSISQSVTIANNFAGAIIPRATKS